MSSFRPHVQRAVSIVGGQVKLAELIGCAQSEVSRLCSTAASIRPEIAVAISKATEGRVPVIDLLPGSVVDAIRNEIQGASRSEAEAAK